MPGRQVDGCPECGSERLVVVAFQGGWKVICGNDHEVFPFPGTTIMVDSWEYHATTLRG